MESNQGNDELPCPSNYTSWKECFHEKVQQRCLRLQETKVRMVHAQKAKEEKVQRREPGDWLAREWYNEDKETLDTRIYLLDKLLPTLIPAVESLLMEVERKHVLVSDQEPTSFDPINYLAEHLMRHNPQYSIPPKPGPYLREMEVVSEELKSLKQDTTSQRLIKMRAEAKNKWEAREEIERKKAEETARRKEVLAALFKEWTVDGTHKIPAALVQSTLRSFPDVTDSIPEEMRKATHERKLKILNTLEKTVGLNKFTKNPQQSRTKLLTPREMLTLPLQAQNQALKFVLSYTEHVSSDQFQEIMEYLCQCAEDFQEATKHDSQREIFTAVFQYCDYEKVGVLDREKILALLRDFYDRSLVTGKGKFWNPREWPIIQLEDIDLTGFWGGLADPEVCEGEILGNLEGTDSMSTSVTEGVDEKTGMSEAEAGTADRQDEALPGSDKDVQDKDLLHDQGKDSGPSVAGIQNLQDSKNSFAASCITLPHFVQLMDNFVGEDVPLPTLKRLTAFIKKEYKQTEEEKMKQLEKIHHMSHMAQRKQLLEALFEKWDSNACGSLDLEEVIAALSSFEGGMGKVALKKAKKHLCSRYPQLSRVGKLSPKAFQTFLELIASEFTDNEDETIDNLVRFLTTSVEQRDTESLQSSARRKWLQDIQQVAETSGTSMEPMYKAVFKALSQDMEAHGDSKRISAYIALLEKNQLSPEQGQVLLRYVACTADDAPYVLNQVLHRDMKGVSFAAVDQGQPIHVPRVQLHGNIHFWNTDRPVEERKGSFLVLPLHDARWRVFGILGLDTLQDQCEKSIFLTHEITFYEGVSHAFSKAYHHICMRQNVLQVAVTALDWLYPRTPSIHTVTVYLVVPGKDKNHGLCKMITTDNTGKKEVHSSPVVLLREENLFRDYLFKCTDSSEVALTSVYGEHHIAVPLHDLSRETLGIFDISIGQHKKLPPQEQKDLQKMLKMTQAACSEILRRSLEETEPTHVLEAEHMAYVRHAGILFHRFMLQELRQCIQKFHAGSFAGIKSHAEPPALVHDVVKAVLLLLNPDWKGSEEIESWSQCKMKLDDNLIQQIYCFDPTASSVQVQAELVLDLISGVPQAAEWQQDSAPAEYLHQWLQTCLALAELTKSHQH